MFAHGVRLVCGGKKRGDNGKGGVAGKMFDEMRVAETE